MNSLDRYQKKKRLVLVHPHASKHAPGSPSYDPKVKAVAECGSLIPYV